MTALGPASIGIVATVREPGASFRTWIDYHMRAVDRLYIFLDEPGNGDERLIPDDPRISVLAGHRESSLSGQSGVMQRQLTNVMHALDLGRRDGLTWLLHIDSDEMIWSPDGSVKSYFEGVAPDVSQVCFVNHEVVPRYEDSTDYFRDVHLFKRNGHVFPEGHWMHARRHGFFNFYGNGKSAVRIAAHQGPSSVHLFNVTGGSLHVEMSTCVLHYACATYRDWFKKHELLGDFQPYWWDNPTMPIEFSFLIDSRDAYLASLRSGDWRTAEDFFRASQFTPSQLDELLAMGAVFRCDPLAAADRP